MSKHTRHSSGESRRHNIAIVCLALLCAALVACLFMHTNYIQYQLANFGLIDRRHTDNSTTVESWNSCLDKLDIDADVVFFGDSITMRYDFQSAFPDKSVVNLGLSADSILDMNNRVYMLETVKPEKIFLMAGVNSLKNEMMIGKYFSQYVSLVNDIRATVPQAELYIISVLPVSASYDNAFL